MITKALGFGNISICEQTMNKGIESDETYPSKMDRSDVWKMQTACDSSNSQRVFVFTGS